MDIQKIQKPSFGVIGKEGFTNQGEGFVQRLWQDANGHFEEIQHLAKRDATGNLAGIWGAMTDFSREFYPWEKDFTEGLYLAGVECEKDAPVPEGWVKWNVPGFEYLAIKCEDNVGFPEMMQYLTSHGIVLAGAVQDFTNPATGESYMYFPIKRI